MSERSEILYPGSRRHPHDNEVTIFGWYPKDFLISQNNLQSTLLTDFLTNFLHPPMMPQTHVTVPDQSELSELSWAVWRRLNEWNPCVKASSSHWARGLRWTGWPPRTNRPGRVSRVNRLRLQGRKQKRGWLGDPKRNEPGVAAIVWGEVWVELVCCLLIRLERPLG